MSCRRRWILLSLVVTLASLSAVGCGDDEPPRPQTRPRGEVRSSDTGIERRPDRGSDSRKDAPETGARDRAADRRGGRRRAGSGKKKRADLVPLDGKPPDDERSKRYARCLRGASPKDVRAPLRCARRYRY
jgi:hypothetical protein